MVLAFGGAIGSDAEDGSLDVIDAMVGATPNTPISETQFVIGTAVVGALWILKIYLWRRNRDRG